jgi:hypothetical protein
MKNKEFRELTGMNVTEFALKVGIQPTTVFGQLTRGYCRLPVDNKYGENHDLYSTWKNMRQRCYNKNNKDYIYYGGRGIRVCKRWLYSFDNFVEDLGPRPEGYTLDRIDNNMWYTEDNCKWSTKSEQVYNRRIFINNTSGSTGVYYDKKSGNWSSSITVKNKTIRLGSFLTKGEALAARLGAEALVSKLTLLSYESSR